VNPRLGLQQKNPKPKPKPKLKVDEKGLKNS
jgi:hypothetical protein